MYLFSFIFLLHFHIKVCKTLIISINFCRSYCTFDYIVDVNLNWISCILCISHIYIHLFLLASHSRHMYALAYLFLNYSFCLLISPFLNLFIPPFKAIIVTTLTCLVKDFDKMSNYTLVYRVSPKNLKTIEIIYIVRIWMPQHWAEPTRA